jgi:DNA repair protein RadA/Sms
VRDRTLPSGTVFLGEIGLGGELRAVTQLERRLVEASRMGFDAAVVPVHESVAGPHELQIHSARDVGEVFARVFA